MIPDGWGIAYRRRMFDRVHAQAVRLGVVLIDHAYTCRSLTFDAGRRWLQEEARLQDARSFDRAREELRHAGLLDWDVDGHRTTYYLMAAGERPLFTHSGRPGAAEPAALARPFVPVVESNAPEFSTVAARERPKVAAGPAAQVAAKPAARSGHGSGSVSLKPRGNEMNNGDNPGGEVPLVECPHCGVKVRGRFKLAEHLYLHHDGPEPEHWLEAERKAEG